MSVFTQNALNATARFYNFSFDPEEVEGGSDVVIEFDTDINGRPSVAFSSITVDISNGSPTEAASNTGGNTWEVQIAVAPLPGNYTLTVTGIDSLGATWIHQQPIQIV